MANAKMTSTEELRKMSSKDRLKLSDELNKDLALVRLHLRTGKEKQGHKVSLMKKQIARIQTLNNQVQDEK
jgi:ribosomal protein L29